MPLLGYKNQFASLVKSLEKRQTIRAKRKRPFKAGDRLFHYVGLRTKTCRKLLESDCVSTKDIMINEKGDVFIDGRRMSEGDKESFAHADGFRDQGSSWEQMFIFFRKVHGLPFEGQLIKW